MNLIAITGRLVADPEARQVGGKTVANLRIAVDRRFKGKDGPSADFFRVEVWGQAADYCEKYLGKGRLVAATGRMECRQYTDAAGNKRESWELKADSVEGLDRPRDDAERPVADHPASDDYDPFQDE